MRTSPPCRTGEAASREITNNSTGAFSNHVKYASNTCHALSAGRINSAYEKQLVWSALCFFLSATGSIAAVTVIGSSGRLRGAAYAGMRPQYRRRMEYQSHECLPGD